jgi:hypothetical protein
MQGLQVLGWRWRRSSAFVNMLDNIIVRTLSLGRITSRELFEIFQASTALKPQSFILSSHPFQKTLGSKIPYQSIVRSY